MPLPDLASEWLAENDPGGGYCDNPYPYLSSKQLRLRRRREIPCGLEDTSAEHVRDAFRAASWRRPRLGDEI